MTPPHFFRLRSINSNLNYNSFKVSIPPVAVGARKQAAAILLPKQMQSLCTPVFMQSV